METIGKIRRRHKVRGESISAIARDLNLSRNTVKKYLKAEIDPVYRRERQPAPKLGAYQSALETWLEQDGQRPKGQRRSAQRLFEDLQREGYAGAYDSVQRFVKEWKTRRPGASQDAFVPLVFAPGEACQFDWSHEQVILGGVAQVIKVAHFRLAHSRQPYLRAYPRESQEMVFDAHNRAFAFFSGVPVRMIYDNPRTVVNAILSGKERQFNRRFLALASHYLFEPVACTPASGWEKGQVENQVGNMREWLFTPTLRFECLADLNAWLETRCRELGKRHHPVLHERSIAEVFAEEQPCLRPVVAAFDGYFEQTNRVSSTCLVSYDRNRYSVPAEHAGQRVSLRADANRIRGSRGQGDCRAYPLFWPGTADPRSLALPAGAGEEARCAQKWRPIQGLGFACSYRNGKGAAAQIGPGRPLLCGSVAGNAPVWRRSGDRGMRTGAGTGHCVRPCHSQSCASLAIFCQTPAGNYFNRPDACS
jgi:transposase